MKIVKYPHPALRFPAKPVSSIDKEIRLLAGQMLELMYGNKGLGLAAPQVAVPVQLMVMNFAGEAEQKDKECIAVNPVLIDKKGVQEGEEGCLSFPGLYQKVRRAKTVTVRAYNLEGQLYEVVCSDLPARLWQHEIDHLHGRLFIDMMGPLGRHASRKMLEDFEDDYRTAQKKGEYPSDDAIRKQLTEYGKAIPAPVM